MKQNKLTYSEYNTIGKRNSNEDAHLILEKLEGHPDITYIGLFDGKKKKTQPSSTFFSSFENP